MKKLLMIVAGVAIATVANAASFSWKLNTGSTYGGMNVYALTGTTATDVLALCASTDTADWDTVVSGKTPTVATTGNRGAAAGTTTGVAAGDNLVWLVVDGAVADGSKYWVTADYAIPTGSTFEPPATGTAQAIAFSAQGNGTFTAGSTPTPPGPGPIPEPTSGLLLLVGGAMLALRRKQK